MAASVCRRMIRLFGANGKWIYPSRIGSFIRITTALQKKRHSLPTSVGMWTISRKPTAEDDYCRVPAVLYSSTVCLRFYPMESGGSVLDFLSDVRVPLHTS